jgi:hypothetical protein
MVVENQSVNLVKLCVGANSVDDLIAWQETTRSRGPDGKRRHVTRMWPKQEDKLLNGGSLYWVFKGLVLCRQRVLRLDEVIRHDGVRMCAIVLDEKIVRTQALPRRPFQGWRYLKPEDAPKDLREGREEHALPPELNKALSEIGVL